MLNNFIYAQTKDLFLEALNAGNILDEAIVFIEDTKEIWNHGHYFGMVGSGSGIDPEVLSGIETAIAVLQSDKADKSELSDYALKSELPSLDGYLTKTVADGLYATIAQYNTLSQTVDNVNTDLQTFKNNVSLTYATDQDVADAVAALVDSSPTTLDTLNELAAALGDDPNFATTVATQIGTKADQTALDATNTNVANLTTKVNGNSVSKSGETLTVSINGSSQSLTNTWRGISDAVDSTSTSVSASSKAVKTAYDKAVAAQSAANTAQTTADNKWTYSASTIAGVKVNNAGNADTATYATTAGSAPASDVYAWAKAANKPSYSHDEITAGNLTIGDGVNSLYFRTNGSWESSIYHHTNSDEAVVFLNKGKNFSGTNNFTTSWIFAYGTPSERPAWTGLTPAMQIKGDSVVINKLLGSKVGASYNLDVNGSANATTLYENGTRVSLSGHTHDSRYYTETEIDTKLAGKWTYNESTIAAVKVNNAGNADTVGGFTVGCNVPANAKFTDNNTTYSAGSGIILSGTQFSHADTSTLSGSYGPTANVTGSNGATIVIPQITVDDYGHVTGVTNRTYTSVNTDTKNTAGSTNSTNKLYLIGATSQAANPQTYSNSGLYATNGTMYATAYYETSDERLKDFKEDVEVDFDKLKSIPKKYFTWKDDETQILQMGTSAQEVQAVYPELVSGDETLHVDYARLVIPALAAIDVLYEENKLLKDKLTKLEEVVYGN